MEGLDGKYVDIGGSGFTLIFLLALAVCLVAYYFLRRRIRKKVLFGVILLFLAGYAIRLLILLKNPYMYGIDGLWYVSKVGYFMEHGNFGAFVAPMTLYFITGLSVLAGDATLGIKIAQAFLSALPILTTWLLVRYLTKNNFVSFVTSLLVALSLIPVSMTDVLRNTGALAFVPLFYLFFLKFVNREGRKWTIKIPKIFGGKSGVTLSTNLVLSILLYLVILGCHFLTAGFVLMTVVAYIAFFTGYRRKLPRPELKFAILLSGLMLLAGLVYAPFQEKVTNSANSIATSEPIPADLFPFYEPGLPAPLEEEDGGVFMFFLPFLLLSLPAMWFALRHNDRRYQLFTATILLCLLCSQEWIVNFMYTFRFLMMIYIALFILIGISIWRIRNRYKKVAVVILAGVIGFSLLSLAGMGAEARPWITEEDWTELKQIGQQLPENSMVIAPGQMELFYWAPLLLEKELGTTYWPGGAESIEYLAGAMRIAEQETGYTCLAVVKENFTAGKDLENLGLEIFDNLQTDRYLVLRLVENSDSAQHHSAAQGEGPGGLPVYPGSTDLQMSKENIEENIFHGEIDLSPPEISAAVYVTTAGYDEVFGWYKTEMPTRGWTKVFENENPAENWGVLVYLKGDRMAMIPVAESPEFRVFVLLEGPTNVLWESPSPKPEATNKILFNSNPLFAFILLPPELVQGLYGTWAYGVTKLIIAIPLSVGLIGFLIGLAPSLARRLKKS